MAVEAKLAGPVDVDDMVRSLCLAFADDPVFSYLAPGIEPAARAKRMRPFFAIETKAKVKVATAWTDPQRRGGALWAAPDQWKTPLREQILMGYPMLVGTRGRVLRGLRLQKVMEENHPREPHWYLAVLGTDPSHQGQGVGGALMAPVLERCDAEGLPAYLESSKESNVPYYERFGFKVTKDLDPGKGAPHLWAMWREPHG